VHIAAWLQDLGLERYEEAFRENEIDWEVLPDLTESDLEKIGLPLGIRKKVLKAIRAIGDGQATDEAKSSQAPAVHPAAERRQVTVLFADLAGYTRLSHTVDAEEVHALLSRFFGLVDGIVKQYGGTIDKHIGDCVMAVFGAPLAHSNDPERAVRAALEIQSSMLSLGDQIGGPVGVHIGVASGQVVASSTGSGDHLEYTVTGDSVNLASRLTDAAKSGETLISDPIQQALRDRLECEEVETLVVKGFASPIRAWRLHGWRGAAGAHRRLFVGRRAELQQFEAALAACRETGCGQAIYIRGEAGIGKTRLIEEFQNLAEAAGFACHIGLVLDFGAGTGRDAIRVLFRGILGLALDAHEADARTAAERALEEELVELEQRVFLNDLLDLPQAPALRALYDTMENESRNRGKSKTVVGLVERTAQRCPLMLVVEDLHWAEPLTMQHLARLTEAVTKCPALLVMTSRLEGDPLDQTWRSETGGSPLTTVDLGPLRRQEAELGLGARGRPRRRVCPDVLQGRHPAPPRIDA
jgi:class 3 adenylate cyclase